MHARLRERGFFPGGLLQPTVKMHAQDHHRLHWNGHPAHPDLKPGVAGQSTRAVDIPYRGSQGPLHLLIPSCLMISTASDACWESTRRSRKSAWWRGKDRTPPDHDGPLPSMVAPALSLYLNGVPRVPETIRGFVSPRDGHRHARAASRARIGEGIACDTVRASGDLHVRIRQRGNGLGPTDIRLMKPVQRRDFFAALERALLPAKARRD